MEWFKSLFGIHRKASAARSLFAIERPARAVWSARRFDSFADEGYAKNVIAFSAINTVAEAAASLPWQLFRNAGAKRVAVAEHPLLSLLARPNPWSGGPALLAAVYGYRQIAGNAYIEAVSGDGDGGGGPPVELFTLRPDRMSVRTTTGYANMAAPPVGAVSRANPPPEVAQRDRVPACAAPTTMLATPISSSTCRTMIPRFRALLAIQCSTPVAGLIGYAA